MHTDQEHKEEEEERDGSEHHLRHTLSDQEVSLHTGCREQKKKDLN